MKTTERHFKIFREECLRLQKAWGLLDWELTFERVRMGPYARVHQDYKARAAHVDFCEEWPAERSYTLNDEHVRDVAKHEMIHLLIAPIAGLVNTRFLAQREAEEGEHAVVQRLMKLL